MRATSRLHTVTYRAIRVSQQTHGNPRSGASFLRVVASAVCYNLCMAGIVGIHGIGQQFGGGYQLGDVWFKAIRDGLVKAGHPKTAEALAPEEVRVAFFGDLFR